MFVISATVLAVLCTCELVVRHPELLRLAPDAPGVDRSQAQVGVEVLAFFAFYSFALWRDWQKTLRNSVGMFGVVTAFLSVSLYGFWLSHPSPQLQAGGQIAAIVSAGAVFVFCIWCALQRKHRKAKARAELSPPAAVPGSA